jgi:hypothetical protein
MSESMNEAKKSQTVSLAATDTTFEAESAHLTPREDTMDRHK